MFVPRILLLTGTPPGDGSVGEIWLKDLCNAYPEDRIWCFTVRKPGFGQPTDGLNCAALKIIDWPFEPPFRPLGGSLGGICSLPETQYSRNVRARGLLRQVVEFAKANKIDLLWAVLDKPIIYRLAAKLPELLGVPLVTSVWDPPETVTRDFELDRISRRIALKDFAAALHRSTRCGVMSEAMQAEYASRYGVQAIVVRYGIERRLAVQAERDRNLDGRFIIGFAGGLYAPKEWRALLSALETINWKIDDRDIVVRVFGSGVVASAKGRACIEYWGWRSMQEVIAVLSQSHFNYLPYWFDLSHRISARLCFPTKLTTYLACGRPVFYHGPEDSSPTVFFAKYPAGLCCHSLEPAVIVNRIEQILRDANVQAQMVAAGKRAVDEELNNHVFFRRFCQLVGIEYSDLRIDRDAVMSMNSRSAER